jgi:hypothetical protein
MKYFASQQKNPRDSLDTLADSPPNPNSAGD